MDIKYFCSWWGLDKLGTEPMLKKIKDAGFDGVEIGIPFDHKDRMKLKDFLDKYELELIAHQYQAFGEFDDYKLSFKNSLKKAASFNPILINSHTGRDYWTIEQNSEIVKIGEDIESEFNIPILHETHRKHFLFSTFSSKQYFDLLPNLKINADFSHWTCVSETMLEDQSEILKEGILRAEHIHARVGFEEGPQISDPRAPEWEKHLAVFTGWWQQIVNKFSKEDRDFLTITPEFGPVPYTWTIPFSNKPVSDFFDINCWMKNYLTKELKF